MLRELYRKFGQLLVRFVTRNDPWAAFKAPLPSGAFGDGQQPVAALQERLGVRPGTVEDLCRWLADCEKVSGADLRYGSATIAELARRLENEHKGNCRAHASWAFAQLHRLGFDPLIVVGRWDQSRDSGEYHAWVLFERNGTTYLLETMEPDHQRMIQPLANVNTHYIPRYSAAASGATYIYLDELRSRLAR